MKAIVVIDIDDNIDLDTVYIAYDLCNKNTEGWCDVIDMGACALKPMPQKKMPKSGEAYPQSMVLIDRWRGYDECINDILGESNESNTCD